MHVLLLSNEYPPFIIGGIGTFMKGLAQGLSKTGVKVTVITGYPTSNILRLNDTKEKHSFRKDEDGVTVIRFPYPDLPPRHTMFQLANLKRLRKTVEEINPDVIHGQSGSTYSLLRGGSRSDFLTYLLGYPAWTFTFRKELDHSTSAIAVSRSLKSDLLNEMGEAYDKKILCIHNGVDLETLKKEYESEPGLEESSDTIPVSYTHLTLPTNR